MLDHNAFILNQVPVACFCYCPCCSFKSFPFAARFSNGSALYKMKMVLLFQRWKSRPAVGPTIFIYSQCDIQDLKTHSTKPRTLCFLFSFVCSGSCAEGLGLPLIENTTILEQPLNMETLAGHYKSHAEKFIKQRWGTGVFQFNFCSIKITF